jgi:5-methylthioribose kinase
MLRVPSSSGSQLTEGAFYQKIAVADTVQQIMPKLLGIDAINNMIALEDLGKMISLFIYDEKRKLQEQELNQLVGYLNGLHQNSEDGG